MEPLEETRLKKESITFIKSHRRELCDKFANLTDYPPSDKPFSIFMAGSPGAGKTEFSISFIKNNYTEIDKNIKVVRIDADEIRKEIPHFNGKNSYIVQSAAALGVEKLFDHVQDKKQNVLIDSTFADLKIARSNVKRALDKRRKAAIFYLYQDPVLAWGFTKKREKLEGRYVPKNMFIDAFLSAKDNVNRIRLEFANRIELNLVIKNFENRVEKTHLNIEKVDNYLKIRYNKEDLYKTLK